MSYFTETFESILEFKGDIAAGYADRRNYERGTNAHRGGKHASRMAKNATNYHMGAKNGEGIKALDYHSITGNETTKEKYKDYNRDAKHHADNSNRQMDVEREMRKKYRPRRESFDPVYEDLCRMGVID